MHSWLGLAAAAALLGAPRNSSLAAAAVAPATGTAPAPLAAALTRARATASEPYTSATFSFRLVVPDGWSAEEAEASATALRLELRPERAAERVRATVRVVSAGAFADAAAVLREALAKVEADEQYKDVEELERRIAGRSVPGISVELRGEPGRLRQAYLVEAERLFILEEAVTGRDFGAWKDEFDDLWSTFAFLEPTDEDLHERRLRAAAERCGSEVQWAQSWEEAAERARRESKLVLAVVRALPGFDISDETLTESFMDPDVIELVSERFVPLRYRLGMDAPFERQEVYGLSATTFGSSALVVTPEGRVFAHERAPFDWFLRDVVARPGFPAGPALRAAKDPLARAEQRVRRGELPAALAELADAAGREIHRARAGILRRMRRGEEALAELAAAREAAGAEGALDVDIDLDEALVLARLGRLEKALERVERALAGAPNHARAPEAQHLRGALQYASGARSAAERTWRRLVDEAPESRWAWKAAGTLLGTAWLLDRGGAVAWPPEEQYSALLVPPFDPGDASEPAALEREAVRYLVSRQEADGSWFSPTEFGRSDPVAADDFELATAAMCVQALLAQPTDAEAQSAAKRGLAWLLAAHARLVESAEPAVFMNYAGWSRAALLACLADCLRARFGDDDLERVATGLVAELAALQNEGGGWSYLVSGDPAARVAADVSMSFQTAAVLLALQRAADAGIEVPEDVLERGLDCLASMRAPDGTYLYLLQHGGAASPQMNPPGAAGRGPGCALALLRGGRTDEKELRGTLELFVRHRGGLTKELGKALMHAGADSQGSHYVLFDQANTAAAIAALGKRERVRFGEALLEELALARVDGGGFLDNPLLGVACGTSQALLALEALRQGS